jgi:hypothetical protein
LIVGRRHVKFVAVGELFAAVERRTQPPTISEEELQSQHEVVTQIFDRVESVLPVRFGAWIEQQELNDLIRRQHAELSGALALVRNRAQMTVRFAVASHRKRRSPPPQSGAEYLRARRDQVPVRSEEVTQLESAVRHLVIARTVKESPTFTAARSEVRHSPRSCLYHLIARESVARYMSVVEPFRSETITVSGPWPPFAFVPDPWL